MLIRDAVDADLDAILAIHNDAILNTDAIWTEQVVARPDREAWLAVHIAAGEPVIVAELDGRVVGYASYGSFRPKTGYRYTVENSVYIDTALRGRGIGRALMVELIARARSAGIHVIVAGIDAGNSASFHLHESLGFERVALMVQVGTKHGRWLDLAMLQLRLDDAALPPTA